MTKHLSKLNAPAPRPTIWAAVLVAVYLSGPVFVVLTLVDWWRAGL
ncbi:MAG: hypothetical protein AAFX59_04920 [Pseudomonadota bacterium]